MDAEDDKTDIELLNHVAGQVHGLIAFAMALTMSHPNRDALRAHYEAAKKVFGAMAEQKPVSEAFLEGMDDVAKRLTNVLRQEAKRNSSPP